MTLALHVTTTIISIMPYIIINYMPYLHVTTAIITTIYLTCIIYPYHIAYIDADDTFMDIQPVRRDEFLHDESSFDNNDDNHDVSVDYDGDNGGDDDDSDDLNDSGSDAVDIEDFKQEYPPIWSIKSGKTR